MREIKFRVWIEPNEWRVTSGMFYPEDREETIDPPYHIGVFGCFDDEDYVFMQFTGLYDKNGVEIYGGDIVRINYGIPPTTDNILVYFYGGCWMTDRIGKPLECPLYDLYSEDLSVVGNIHQNPELLEEK